MMTDVNKLLIYYNKDVRVEVTLYGVNTGSRKIHMKNYLLNYSTFLYFLYLLQSI